MNNILYCPLDLPPVPKEINLETVEDMYDYIPNFNEQQIDYLRSKKQLNAYTWKLIKLRVEKNTNLKEPCSGPDIERWKSHDNNWEWTDKAKKIVPDLIDYIEKYLPYDQLKYVVILNSVGKVDPHFDIPPGVNYDLKKKYLESEPSQYRLLLDGSLNNTFYITTHLFDKTYVELPKDSPGWAMGSYTCRHGNDELSGDKKLLCVITGEINLDKHRALLERSFNKFKEYAVLGVSQEV